MATEGGNESIVDLSRVLVADNNLFTRNQYHTHDADGFANEVFILVNGGTGTRVVRLGGAGSCDRTIPCLMSSDTPFIFISTEELHQLLNSKKEKPTKGTPAPTTYKVITYLNSGVVGATQKREDAVVVVVVSSSAEEDEELFQFLVQESNVTTLHTAFPMAAYVVLGADIHDDITIPNSLQMASKTKKETIPPCSPGWTVIVAPTKLVTAIYDDDGSPSPSAAPCRLILSKVSDVSGGSAEGRGGNNGPRHGGKWTDCTHIVDSNSPFFPGGQMPLRCPAKRCKSELKNTPTTSNFQPPPRSHQPVREVIITGCDVGTHMDSPRHFYSNLASISNIPPSKMMGIPVVIVDVSHKCLQHEQQASATNTPLADYTITVADLKAAEKELVINDGVFTWEGALVLAHTGWWKQFTEAQDTKNANIYKRGKLSKEHQITATDMWFPGFSKEAAEWLLDRNINGIGIDTLSLDCGSSEEFPVHQVMLGAGKYQIENVNFSEIMFGGEAGGRTVARTGAAIAAPMLVEGAFESQTRLLLQIDN